MGLNARQYRDTLGRFATGVCVITTSPKGHKPLGITVNSFAALSVGPPLVLWSIQKNSDCLPTFELAIQFVVNILDRSQRHLSKRYAGKLMDFP